MKKRILTAAFIALSATAAHAQNYDNSYCREFTQQVRIGGVYHNAYGTSCRQPDGSWKVVQEPTPYPTQQYAAQPPEPVEYYDPRAYAYSEPYYYPAYYPGPYYYGAPFAFSFGYSNWHGGDWGHGGWHGGGGWHH